ncbi:MAG TPA: 2-C-methyl-D-erythritol 2,4-cyclodiphosphate synthase [Candidatus Hydrogenedentes bacterium]|nr:2-C-methyl-D-erythritol 2,4-cyclodiphosphate synthase [Candidatus Hydrogenedentota bacterium]
MHRIGIGYDIHPLIEGRPLILGGVRIEYVKGLMGHSDADVLTHAIIDAMLGATALGDLGQHFPDRDPAYRNASSFTLLEKTVRLVHKAGYTLVNVDSNVVLQEPKLSPYIERICATLAEPLGVVPERVSVKARTNERFGPEGCGEAASAHAVVLLESR